MTISVVTISLNQAPFLERCLLSVISGNHPDEYVVIDAGSTDGSIAILDRHRTSITRVVCEGDDGPADGLNKGYSMTHGEIFGYLNADDVLLPGALAAAARELERHPEIDVVYGDGFVADGDGSLVRRVRSSPISGHLLALGLANVLQQATFFRRSALDELAGDSGGPFNPRNRTCWDAELLVDLVLAGKSFRRIRSKMGVFTLHAESISGSQRLALEYERDRQRLRAKLRAAGFATHSLPKPVVVAGRLATNPVDLWWSLTDRLRSSTYGVPGLRSHA